MHHKLLELFVKWIVSILEKGIAGLYMSLQLLKILILCLIFPLLKSLLEIVCPFSSPVAQIIILSAQTRIM